MKQQYFILVLAHSLHGRLRRVHIPHQFIYGILALALFGCFSVFGFVGSYARMAWKVANYNALRREAEDLRGRYQNLQRVVNQTNEQLASLESLASEVSAMYGIKRRLEGPGDIAMEGKLAPSFSESVQEYNYLRSSSLVSLDRNFSRRWHLNPRPSIWPVEYGRVMSSFGQRTDPFSGEGAIHSGVDISAPTGTVAHATADGVVEFAARFAGYGRLVIVDHGNGLETYYAHLARFDVMPGQEIRRGQSVGAVGASGRVTAPHLHYEVRVRHAPVNPYRYLSKAPVTAVKSELPF
jgi:murein DD-endopeptidase MepM/ murein hydrolase activator NlpD